MATYFRVTTPVEGSDGKTRFREVDVAFPAKDGQKFQMRIELDAFPVNGELVLFEPRPEDED